VLLGIALTLLGCSRTTAPGGSGAEQAVLRYYEAIIRQDWPAAYAALHPDSRKRWSSEQFTQSAQHYRRNLGFEPDGVRIRACEEHATEAVAHVVLTGRTDSGRKYHKDAVTLRPSGSDWGVVLSSHFGQRRK
jgi:hypothetical protein